ncbi:MAG TPA: TetR/AcrR family transcriptional regulator [Polyangiales bacterium]|nr:TetR/AcrR family transcriptional regulator [Polyangiales bacterium]
MGRPREFDETQVLDRALEVFWRKGYEGASVEDLVQATGLSRASLYGAFGDKDKLYERAIERYRDEHRADIEAIVASASTATEALQLVLRSVLSSSCSRSGPRGCFLLAAGTSGQGPGVAREALRDNLDQLERVFMELVGRGQRSGEFRRDVDATAQARMLVVLLQGMASTARGGWGKDRLEAAAQAALAQLTG